MPPVGYRTLDGCFVHSIWYSDLC